MRGGLFPFDGAGGLGSQIPQNTVDAGDLVSDAVHDVLHHAEVQLGHLGGDGIHPNDEGTAAYAKLIHDTMEKTLATKQSAAADGKAS